MQTTQPEVEVLHAAATYRDDPTALFNQLCGARQATLLLESAEIDNKRDLQSLMVLDSALRISALGPRVTLQALTANGAALLPLLDAALPAQVTIEKHPNRRELIFPAGGDQMDEDARLRALS